MQVSDPHTFLELLKTYKPITDLLIASAPAMTALFVAYIGWRQWKTAADKLRFDLYQRRLRIYQTSIEYYVQLPEVNNEAIVEFNKAVLESRFLFDESSGIYRLLLDMQRRGTHMINVRSNQSFKELDKEMKIEEQNKALNSSMWFGESALPELTKKLLPYLTFRHGR